MNKAIFFDRDGVINEDLWGYVTKNEEFHLIDGSLEAIASLTDAGFHIAVATNQACINRKIINKKQLDNTHHKLTSFVNICPSSFIRTSRWKYYRGLFCLV